MATRLHLGGSSPWVNHQAASAAWWHLWGLLELMDVCWGPGDTERPGDGDPVGDGIIRSFKKSEGSNMRFLHAP